MVDLDPVVLWILRASLALLFAVAAFHKFADRAAFVRAVRDYRLLPDALAAPLAAGVACVEAGVAAALLAPASAGLGAAVGTGLLCLYSTAIAWNLARGRRDIDCGCAGSGSRRPLSGQLLVRNGLLVLACGLAAGSHSGRALGWLDVVSIAGGVVVTGLLHHAIERSVAAGLAPVGRPG